MDDFLNKIKITGTEPSYIYVVTTYGTTTGQAGTFVQRHMKKRGLNVDAFFSVKMPDTWTPMFDLSNKEKVRRINERELPQIQKTIKLIGQQAHGNFMKGKVPMFAVKIYRPTYENSRKTSHFQVLDSCVGCGLCEKNCPVKAIEMQNKRPVWVKEKCVMCLGCLHRCPAFAIQYGKETRKHGQYIHP